jgi:hypothetical protein
MGADMNGAMRRMVQLAAVLGLALLLVGMGSHVAGAQIVNYKDTTSKSNFKKGCDSVGGAYTEEHGGKVGICTTGGVQDRCNFKTHNCSNGLVAQPGGPAVTSGASTGALVETDPSGADLNQTALPASGLIVVANGG